MSQFTGILSLRDFVAATKNLENSVASNLHNYTILMSHDLRVNLLAAMIICALSRSQIS